VWKQAYLVPPYRASPLKIELYLMDAKGIPSASEPSAGHEMPTPDHGVDLSGDGDDHLIGHTVGGVEIVRQIAEGGMGRVYEGLQRIGMTSSSTVSHETRRVAVKVLKTQLASPEMRLRFAAEARLLARLDHPGIARIHGAGTHDCGDGSLHYIVMEFIPDAQPLVEYADSVKLSTRQRLVVFREVCDAVAHAHLKGVIHRDLKPGNIVVAGSGPLAGHPRVIDFGIARATDIDTSRITRHSDFPNFLGTLQYMSPEQFGDDPDSIDIRTDVYSLGVVLYELLTGRPPYEIGRKAAFEVARIVRDENPTPLSAVNRTLRRDVSAIAHKCLEKAPAHRYSSAAELAADVKRHLEGQAVSASAPGFVSGLVRVAYRHRVAAASALAIIAAGITALVVIGIFAARADYRRAEAVKATARAERSRAAAEDLVQFMTFNLRDRLTEMGRQDLLAGVLDQLARYHESSRLLAADGLEKPSARQLRQRGVFLNNLGDMERALGRSASAYEAYLQSLAIAESLVAETPESIEFQRDLSVSHRKMGALAAELNDIARARQHFLVSRHILENLVELAPNDPTRKWDLAGILDSLGQLAFMTGDMPAARREFTTLRDIMQALTASDPTNSDWRRDEAIAFQKLGGLEHQSGNNAAAKAHYEEALEVLAELQSADPENRQLQWDTCVTMEKLASVCASDGDTKAAQLQCRDALAIAEKLVATDPYNTRWIYQHAVCHERLGRFALDEGDFAAAVVNLRIFQELIAKLADEHRENARWQRELATAYGHLGALALRNHDRKEAREWYQRALETADKAFAEAKDAQSVAFRLNILRPLMECHKELGELPDAEACQSRIESLQNGRAELQEEPAA
jgi:tetratricopeptide (TPR) repeat protein